MARINDMNASLQLGADAQLQPNAWRPHSIMRTLLAILIVFTGLSPVLLLDSPIPRGVLAIELFTGLFWLGLAAAVWQGRSNAVRKCIALILAGQAIGWIAWFIARPDDGWLEVVEAAAFLVIAVGVWRALEWARWAALAAGAFVFVANLTSVMVPWGGLLVGVQIVVTFAILAIFMVYAARPSTRDQFAMARSAR